MWGLFSLVNTKKLGGRIMEQTYFVELCRGNGKTVDIMAYIRTTDRAIAYQAFDSYIEDIRYDRANGADGVRIYKGRFYEEAELVESYIRLTEVRV